jgi:hypothetical protein
MGILSRTEGRILDRCGLTVDRQLAPHALGAGAGSQPRRERSSGRRRLGRRNSSIFGISEDFSSRRGNIREPCAPIVTPVHTLHFTQTIEAEGGFGRTRDSTRESTTKRVQIRTI